jgi:hypothetical protein
MPYGSSSAAGDVGVARTGLRITRAMQPSVARGETSGLRPLGKRGPASCPAPVSRPGCATRTIRSSPPFSTSWWT